MDILANKFEMGELMEWGFVEEELGMFEPDDTGMARLDEKVLTKCPECGKIFDHATNQA